MSVEIRAHVTDDLIRIDIHDGRRTPGAMTIRLEEDAPAALNSDETCGVCFWHENPADAVAPDKPENSGTGADIPGDNKGWLGGRVFGLALKSENESCVISDRTLTFPARARHSLLIAGVSTLGGKDRFVREARERQNKAVREGGEAFLRTHETWWNDFWRRSRLVIHDPTGRMLKYQAAFDLYRYYLACCAGERRETPPRFQIDLYRYHLRQHDWLTGIICAVEQYQSYYGAMRTGDWGALRGLASFYAAKLPYYGHFARRATVIGGARIPMWQGAAVLAPPTGAGQEQPPVGIWQKPYNGENPAGQIWMLSLFCDYVSITGDQDFAHGVLSPLAADLTEFVRLRYPQRDQGRMVHRPVQRRGDMARRAGPVGDGVRAARRPAAADHRGSCTGLEERACRTVGADAGERARSPAGEVPVSGRGCEAGDSARRSIGAGGGHERLRRVQTALVRRQVALPVERAADGAIRHLARETGPARQRSAGWRHALVP